MTHGRLAGCGGSGISGVRPLARWVHLVISSPARSRRKEIEEMAHNVDLDTIDQIISTAFRRAYERHPERESDPALAVDSARETASELVPPGVTGSFADESLTFRCDMAECVGLDDETILARGATCDGPWRHYSDHNAIEWIDIGGAHFCRENDEAGFAETLRQLNEDDGRR